MARIITWSASHSSKNINIEKHDIEIQYKKKMEVDHNIQGKVCCDGGEPTVGVVTSYDGAVGILVSKIYEKLKKS